MPTVELAEAESRLSSILDRVEAGESFVITRQGRAVARVSAAETHISDAKGTKKPVPFEELATFRQSMPRLTEPSADIIRALRDEEL